MINNNFNILSNLWKSFLWFICLYLSFFCHDFYLLLREVLSQIYIFRNQDDLVLFKFNWRDSCGLSCCFLELMILRCLIIFFLFWKTLGLKRLLDLLLWSYLFGKWLSFDFWRWNLEKGFLLISNWIWSWATKVATLNLAFLPVWINEILLWLAWRLIRHSFLWKVLQIELPLLWFILTNGNFWTLWNSHLRVILSFNYLNTWLILLIA